MPQWVSARTDMPQWVTARTDKPQWVSARFVFFYEALKQYGHTLHSGKRQNQYIEKYKYIFIFILVLLVLQIGSRNVMFFDVENFHESGRGRILDF